MSRKKFESLEKQLQEAQRKMYENENLNAELIDKIEYDTVNEEGEIIKGVEEAREYIADYFENLYRLEKEMIKGENGLKR